MNLTDKIVKLKQEKKAVILAHNYQRPEIQDIADYGFCPTHLLFQPEDVTVLKLQHPNATVMVHPECSSEMRHAADFVGSTSKMCRYATESKAKEFIVGTEEGLLHRLRKENPDKKFYVAYDDAVCPNMKLTTLDRLYASLKEEKYVVKVPENTARKARKSLERMFQVKA